VKIRLSDMIDARNSLLPEDSREWKSAIGERFGQVQDNLALLL
jgi:hypothetical protein